jgi:molybdopterin molybdotransferase
VIPLDDARARVLGACGRLPTRTVPLDDALGCVTDSALCAIEPVPPFANTAMDGYAVRAADTADAPVTLAVAGTLPAGADPSGVHVAAGQAVRIMTGAAMPGGADAVVMVELTHTDDGGRAVVVDKPAQLGDHIRAPGSDVLPGQVVVDAGTVLGPGDLGVLATIGCTHVAVVPRARVGVMSTGDELVEGSAPLRPGQIRDANRHTLVALLRGAGCEPVDLGIVRDDEAALEAAIGRAMADCDALITSGGVSVGDFDYVKAVLDRLGDMAWMQVAIKPAKPLAFGVVGGKPVFGLPGNTVSAMVSFELFARPGLRQMMGHADLDRPAVDATAEEDLQRRPDGKIHFARVQATGQPDGRYTVRSAGGQSSHQLRSMAAANALAVLPDGHGVAVGETVRVMLLS